MCAVSGFPHCLLPFWQRVVTRSDLSRSRAHICCKPVDGSGPPWFTATSTSALIVDDELVYAETTTEWASGSLQLTGDATFSNTSVLRETVVLTNNLGIPIDTTATTIPDTRSGTFSVTGTSIQLTYTNGTVNTASLLDDVLTVIVKGAVWVYER